MQKRYRDIIRLMLTAALIWPAANLPTWAQLPQYQLSRIMEQEGLSTAEVIGMAMDNRGHLWIATQAKVQRFDGRHTTPFYFDETIYQLFIDSRDRIWVTTTLYVYCLSEGSAQFEKKQMDIVQGETPLRVFERRGAGLMMQGSQRIYRYDEQKGSFSTQAAGPAIKDTRFLRFFASNDRTEYYSTASGILRYDPAADRVDPFPFTSLQTLQTLGNEGAIVSTYLFTSYWLGEDGREPIPIRSAKGNRRDPLLIYHAVLFRGHQYLVSTNRGLLLFDTHTQQLSEPVFYYKGEPLRDPNAAKFLYRSYDGTLFICHADGIYFFRPDQRSI
ncbi:MAG TPA: hypothetical protein VK907_14100, partial [Phnomibacter sp.]|nr:hypothetical protein [Phnomibacter sp.]